jgi:TPR repeat protein
MRLAIMAGAMRTAALILALALAGAAVAEPYGDGLAAYGRKDYATALRLWKPMAEQGNDSVQFNLGIMYDIGLGVPKDYALAVKWYRLAAEQNHGQAQTRLGIMYDTGRGVPKDEVLGYMWLNLAAASGEESGGKNRDIIAIRMTGTQIAEAQRLSREWKPR